MAPSPSPDELAAYRRGSLTLDRFQVVDAWIAALDPVEQIRLLENNDVTTLPMCVTNDDAFRSDRAHSRFTMGASLGRGGMGDVRLAHDQLLDRDVAIKLCRARAPDEPLVEYTTRLRAFRREAAITAQLEHPAIVPIHDAGVGAHGEPAYVMKRVEGHSLEVEVTARATGAVADLAQVVETVLRVAEAIAHAHQRGIVHRDLKPANIIAGNLGTLAVLDWGLAARIGDTGDRAGTPAWMAPEQERSVAADPRMDVYALGGLLLGLLTGIPPRPNGSGDPDLQATHDVRVPRGLGALIRTCLHRDPVQRPADGTIIVSELKRWLSAGVTAAEQPSFARRTIMLARRSPHSIALMGAVLVMIIAIFATVFWSRQQELQALRHRIQALADTPLNDLPAVRVALQEISGRLASLPEARALSARFQATVEAAEIRHHDELRRIGLGRLAARYREHGPWADEISDLRRVLSDNGVSLADSAADARLIRNSPLRIELLAALVNLQRAVLLDGRTDPLTVTIPTIIREASDDRAWRGIADLLAITTVEAHDLVLCECPASEAALSDPTTADLLLAVYGPEARLVRYANERLLSDPGAFWPRIICARAAYDADDNERARLHALIALGRESHSVWPRLLLAYLAVRVNDNDALRRESDAGLSINPEHLELRLLRVIAQVRTGDRQAAITLLNDATVAAHLQYHRQHPHGHPMEDAVAALLAEGVALPEVPAEIGPLVPSTHEHHQ